MNEPDPASIRAAANGDVDAFTEIVLAFQTPVWRFVARLLDDRGLAEDVTQETFLRAYRRLPSYAFRSKFSTWLFQIARNAAIDEQRAGARRERLRQQSLLPTRAGESSDSMIYIDAGLRALAPKLRDSLVTVEVLGFTYRDAAKILGVPEGTVKRRVHDARLSLARWLANDGGVSRGEV